MLQWLKKIRDLPLLKAADIFKVLVKTDRVDL